MPVEHNTQTQKQDREVFNSLGVDREEKSERDPHVWYRQTVGHQGTHRLRKHSQSNKEPAREVRKGLGGPGKRYFRKAHRC